jgi:hypothetical protein
MSEARGRGRSRRNRGRSRQNKHTNVRQMMVCSSPAPPSSLAPAFTSASTSPSFPNHQAKTTAQHFTQLPTLSQPGTRSRKSEVHVPYVPIAHTSIHLPVSTNGSEAGIAFADLDDNCEMTFDGPLDGADDLVLARDNDGGEMDASDKEEESDPEMRREKERLADV